MDPIIENAIEIDRVARRLISENKINNDHDEMPDCLLKETIEDLAREYEILRPGPSETYYEDIEKFATIRLMRAFGSKEIKERNLDVHIETKANGSTSITISDVEAGCPVCWIFEKADEDLATEIGKEILSWVSIAKEVSDE